MRTLAPHCAVLPMPAEEGVALVTTLIELTLFSILALYVSLSATNEVRVADNLESHIQARYAALAGLNHARSLMRGLDFKDLLKGPDGLSSPDPGYVAAARTFSFRNPLEWSLARFLDSAAPEADLGGAADDGLVNTGAYGSVAGRLLIPGTGVALLDGGGSTVLGRYFVKVTDNNGEASELAGDPADDPFYDGDGTVLVRSMGIAPTILELAGSAVRRNAVLVYEGRFRRSRAFDLDAPLVMQGDDVRPCSEPMFQGLSFLIRGETGGVGIAGIDVDPGNLVLPAAQIRSRLAADQFGSVVGEGVPSVGDMTAAIAADPQKSTLLDRSKLSQWLAAAPQFADNFYAGDEAWGLAEIGRYDPGLPLNDPEQMPRVTFVGGNLTVNGTVSGAGILVVKGRLTVTGNFSFSGLILVVGEGELDLRPASMELRGGMYAARIEEELGSWGTPALTVGGSSRLIMDRQAIRMALRLMPAEQRGFRQVTPALDP